MNITKLPNNIIVTETKIIGTNLTIYAAWEPSSCMGPHSSLYSYEGQVYGRISSRNLPRKLVDLEPRSNRRFVEVRKWQTQQDQESYEYVLAAFPGLEGKREMGEIKVDDAP